MSVMSVEGSSDCRQRLLRGLDFGDFRRVLGRFWRVLKRKSGRFEAFLSQNWGKTVEIWGRFLPGLCLLGDKKV